VKSKRPDQIIDRIEALLKGDRLEKTIKNMDVLGLYKDRHFLSFIKLILDIDSISIRHDVAIIVCKWKIGVSVHSPRCAP